MSRYCSQVKTHVQSNTKSAGYNGDEEQGENWQQLIVKLLRLPDKIKLK
jgi:hypothetical protein